MNRTARLLLSTSVALATAVPFAGGVAWAAPSTGGSSTEVTTVATTVTVRDGDSLAGLAWRHGVRLSVLLHANALQLDSVIHPGDTIVIPAGATKGGGGATTSTTSRATSPSTPPAPTVDAATSDYVIRAGDALAGIAWRHGVTLGALTKANGLEITSLILPGQRLSIPAATRPIPTGITNSGAAGPTAVAAVGAPATSPTVVTAPASRPGSSLDTLLSYATAQVGAPYRFFSAGPETFDCSGLVVAAFRQIGMSVPHQSRALAKLGSPVDWRSQDIAAGDLVFTSASNDPAMITHVGIALDSQRWVHAIGFGRTVSIGSLPSDGKIMAVQRIALP
jgi:cell wall-associated NlpC family hydrolase